MGEIARTELWTPGQGYELPQEYPVPTTEELQAHWENYLGGEGEVVAAPEVYGVIRVPQERPRAYVSVDLCEVLRQTSVSFRTIEEVSPKPIGSIHRYGDGLSIVNDSTAVTVLMANGFVPPVRDIESIASIMKSWHEAGAYIFANTSTLPGCELATIRFFEQYLPNIFDGLLLPRNHDGSLSVTKGIAARNLLQSFGEGDRPLTAIHIDDLAHHNVGFRDALGSLPSVQAATFQPIYPSHFAPDQDSVHAATPLEAFQRADAFLAEQLR